MKVCTMAIVNFLWEKHMEEMPIQMLSKDHRKVEELLSACKNTRDSKERGEILEKIIRELEVHMQVEEELFYPLVSGVSDEGEQMIKHGKTEHNQLREIISDLKGVSQPTEEDDENIKRLEMLKSDHVREEEQKVFPFAQQNLEDKLGTALAAKMLALKEKLKMETMM